MRYEVKQDKFSGPLEKLLELIEAKELEITLINLAQVTGDFLEYLKALDEKSKHPSVLADFIVVASRLLLIKSKAILPSLALTEEEETDIKDLEMRLKIYREFSAKGSRSMGDKNASIFLNDILQRKMCSYGRELFANLPIVFYPSQNITAKSLEENILDLISELKGLIPEKQTVRKVVVTIEQKMKELLERFKEQAESTFSTISKDKPKIEIIILFLAILHLLRDKIIIASQENQFADIFIKK
ncbi:MAG: segregation/condensation protein A [Patescibacteria group bacterium]